MSIKSWKRKFYKTDAFVAAHGTAVQAIEHSLKKWKGLTKENMREHKVFNLGGFLYNEKDRKKLEYMELEDDNLDFFEIDSGTCALCVKFTNYELPSFGEDSHPCQNCPLYITLGGSSCDEESWEKMSPYESFVEKSNAKPMIRALERALKFQKKWDKKNESA